MVAMALPLKIATCNENQTPLSLNQNREGSSLNNLGNYLKSEIFLKCFTMGEGGSVSEHWWFISGYPWLPLVAPL